MTLHDVVTLEKFAGHSAIVAAQNAPQIFSFQTASLENLPFFGRLVCCYQDVEFPKFEADRDEL
jgi:hypothetical protein